MKLFIVDTETTGLDPVNCNLIEVAGCIYDTETKTILESYQSLIYGTENVCESINHISPEAMKKMPQDQMQNAKDVIEAMADDCEFIIAHNAEFDRSFLVANGFSFDNPWVCSKNDIVYPGKHNSGRLGHLCYDFDIPVLKAHSALHDVYILIELLKKVPDLEQQLKSANEPKETYYAIVDFDNKDLAKSKGFNWDRANKVWKKDMKAAEAESIIKEGLLQIEKAE